MARGRPVRERLWLQVYVTESCWEWRGSRDGGGYGVIRLGGSGSPRVGVHRLVYELLVGPIPDGLHIDHLCRNTICCFPTHLEPVTPRENYARGMSPSAVSLRTGLCVQGLHAMNGTNVYLGPDGKRKCRTCQSQRLARTYQERK